MGEISVVGILVLILVLLPNAYYYYQYRERFEKANATSKPKGIVVGEQIGRYGCMFFMVVHFGNAGIRSDIGFALWVLGVMLLILIYWQGWSKFFIQETRQVAILLAVVPIVVFLMTGIVFCDWLLIFCSILFGSCHISISYENFEDK